MEEKGEERVVIFCPFLPKKICSLSPGLHLSGLLAVPMANGYKLHKEGDITLTSL